MKIIRELTLTEASEQTIRTTAFWTPLCVTEHRGRIVLHLVENQGLEPVERTIHVRATDQTLTGAETHYIGTVCLPSGSTYHVFS